MAMKTFLIVLSLAAINSEVSKGRQKRMRQEGIEKCLGEGAVQRFHDASSRCFAAAPANLPGLAMSRIPADAIEKLAMAAQRKSGTMNNAKFGKLWKATSQLVESLERERLEAYGRMDLILCPLKELGALDDNLEMDLPSMMKEADVTQFREESKREKFKSSIRICLAKIQGMGDGYFKGVLAPQGVKVEMWLKCYRALSKSYCADQLAKEMFEKKFGPFSKLVQATGMEEKALLDVAQDIYV